jgi:large subunit ribosomal protein L30
MTPAANGEDKTLRVRQVKSPIGFEKSQGRTLRAMGLTRIGKVREMPDNGATRGMIAKVAHLVEVEEA